MRARTVAVAAAVVAAVALPAAPASPKQGLAAPAAAPVARMARPGLQVRDVPRPVRPAWRTSVATVSSVTPLCFGHYARHRRQDVWIYGEVVDGATGRRGSGWLWAGDLPVAARSVPYC
ncbi:hypothetical protein AB0M20_32125 [Actinoplanes sp. NPDC051633]|uniref:hypothetical protein n=1 Tax=Actinoplanes sp. NPDC051633 TaxID=3155670 RepID=UPI003432E6EC